MRACAADVASLGLVNRAQACHCECMGNTNEIEKLLNELTAEARDSLYTLLTELWRIDGATQREVIVEAHRQGVQDGVATAAQRIERHMDTMIDECVRERAKAFGNGRHSVAACFGMAAQKLQKAKTKIQTGEWLQDDEERIETVRADEVRVGQMVDPTGDGDYRLVVGKNTSKSGRVLLRFTTGSAWVAGHETMRVLADIEVSPGA